MNFAKLVKLAMRNGFANFAKWFANFAMRNFAKVLMLYVRQMNSVLALRNWHYEIGIAKLALRNWQNWHCEIRIANFRKGCQHIANFGNAKFR